MNEYLGTLSKEDTARWQEIVAVQNAISMNPTAFSQEETIRNQRQWFKMMTEARERFGIAKEELRGVSVSAVSGQVCLEDD